MKEGRLHVRLSRELADSFKDYAKRHHTTVTALVQQHLLELLREEDRQARLAEVEVGEQI